MLKMKQWTEYLQTEKPLKEDGNILKPVENPSFLDL